MAVVVLNSLALQGPLFDLGREHRLREGREGQEGGVRTMMIWSVEDGRKSCF